MKDAITEIFAKWIEGPVSHYHLAGKDIYQVSNANTPKRSPLNHFLQNDVDVRIKFGGFLEQKLLDGGGDLTVHSGLNLAQDNESFCCPDLSIHEVPNNFILAASGEGSNADTVRAAIQVRFIDYLSPKNKTLDLTDFHTDFERLIDLQEKVERFLLIIDEGKSMDSDVIGDLIKMARYYAVTLLSNNERLYSENV